MKSREPVIEEKEGEKQGKNKEIEENVAHYFVESMFRYKCTISKGGIMESTI